MESLETLDLFICTSLQEFLEICGDMQRLLNIYVGSPWIRSLSPSLSGLRVLHLIDCKRLATLPNSLFESQQLEDNFINQCSGLANLPMSFGVQKTLRWLQIERCENLKKLPGFIQMESVQQLMISNSPKLDTFPEIKGEMHCLEYLNLDSTGIREVPSFIWQLRGLKSLSLKGYEDLVSLPDSLCNLMNLHHLSLIGCEKLDKLPENIGDLQELGELDVSDTAISQPPPSITKLGKLWKLSFSHDEQPFQHSSSLVLHQLSSLSSLGELDLSNRNILGGLPKDIGSLRCLRELNVSGSNILVYPKASTNSHSFIT